MMVNGVRQDVHQMKADRPVGQIIEGNLVSQVSVRDGIIVVRYLNQRTKQSVEVSYTPKVAREYGELMFVAAGLVDGKGLQV